jgi:hypothetical protein
MFSIDFVFISRLEYEDSHEFTVSVGDTPNSGVIIGPEFDLGASNETELRDFGLNPTLIGKLYPYLGLKGHDASSYLAKLPLQLTLNELAHINAGLKRHLVKELALQYDAHSGFAFADIPACWQTVILSLESQHFGLQNKFPLFWSFIVNQEWDKALVELRDFGDSFDKRRNLEADYIVLHS